MLTFVVGPIAVLRGHHRRYALVGLASGAVAVVLGGTTVQFEQIDQTPYSLGLDWFVLALFFAALVFVPLEHHFARRPVAVFRRGWRTDAVYFFMSHVLVQFILLMVTAVDQLSARLRRALA